MTITIQKDVFTIIGITVFLSVVIILLSKKIDKADPMEKPKGILLPVIWGVNKIYEDVRGNVGSKIGDIFTPYILTIAVYIFCSNIISMFGIDSPTANLSVTLLLAIATWTIIQVTEFVYSGIGGYFHQFLEPIPIMLPMNIVGKFTMILSLSIRLFGNMLCGSIMMNLIYSFCQFLSDSLGKLLGASGGVFNFLAPIITPVLHAYFDCFSAFIQTLVFVTLTMVLVGNDIPEEIRKV